MSSSVKGVISCSVINPSLKSAFPLSLVFFYANLDTVFHVFADLHTYRNTEAAVMVNFILTNINFFSSLLFGATKLSIFWFSFVAQVTQWLIFGHVV